jgi:hypothetical protein
MCVVSTPKVDPKSDVAKTPDPAIIRNTYLDGIDPTTKALRSGRTGLRIERASPGAATSTVIPPLASAPLLNIQPVLPKITPVQGGGGGGRFNAARALY